MLNNTDNKTIAKLPILKVSPAELPHHKDSRAPFQSIFFFFADMSKYGNFHLPFPGEFPFSHVSRSSERMSTAKESFKIREQLTSARLVQEVVIHDFVLNLTAQPRRPRASRTRENVIRPIVTISFRARTCLLHTIISTCVRNQAISKLGESVRRQDGNEVDREKEHGVVLTWPQCEHFFFSWGFSEGFADVADLAVGAWLGGLLAGFAGV